jgi:hypothetical protein
MSRKVFSIALAAATAAASILPSALPAQADPGRHYGSRHAYGGHYHRGHRGYWHNGKWIALGILGAAVGAAIADSEYRHCTYRYGRRYCDY